MLAAGMYDLIKCIEQSIEFCNRHCFTYMTYAAVELIGRGVGRALDAFVPRGQEFVNPALAQGIAW